MLLAHIGVQAAPFRRFRTVIMPATASRAWIPQINTNGYAVASIRLAAAAVLYTK